MRSPISAPDKLRVQYRCLAGVHVFTSVDFPGLHVAHKSMEGARVALPKVAGDLARLNWGIDVAYEIDRARDGADVILARTK